MAEFVVGQEDGVTPENINFFQDVTFSDLLNAIDEEYIEGPADLLVLGKQVNSGKGNREVGGFTLHLDDILELSTYAEREELDPDLDTNEIIMKLCNLPELPERIVGFVIREA